MTPSAIKDNVILGSSYLSFFCFVFFVSAYFTFPYDRLKGLIDQKLAASADGPDALQVQLGTLEPSWFTGVALSDVTVTRPAGPDSPAASLHFDEVHARAGLWSLLMGNVTVSLAADSGNGDIDGVYGQDEGGSHVEAELHDLDLKKLGLGDWLGIPIQGKANGNIDFTVNEDPMKTTGKIDLKIAGLHLADGKTKIKVPSMSGGMTIDEINAGNLETELHAAEGLLEIDTFKTDGKDLKLDGSGTLRLATPMRRSRPDILLQLKFNDSYKNKTDRTKSLFELLGMQPEWRRATGPDGTLRLRIGGSLQSLRASPSTAGPITRSTASKKPRATAK